MRCGGGSRRSVVWERYFAEDGIEMVVEAAAGVDFGAAELGGGGEELFADVGGVGDDGDVSFVGGVGRSGEVKRGLRDRDTGARRGSDAGWGAARSSRARVSEGATAQREPGFSWAAAVMRLANIRSGERRRGLVVGCRAWEVVGG